MSLSQTHTHVCVLIKQVLDSRYLFDEEKMKAEPESYEEDEENKSKLGGGGEDVLEHEDVDPEVGDVLEVGEEVQPGRRDQEGSHGPLPALKQNHP